MSDSNQEKKKQIVDDEDDETPKTWRQKIRFFCKFTNIICAIFLIVFAVLSLPSMAFNLLEIWKMFSPFFCLLLAFILICTEFKIKIVMKYFPFLRHFIGLGVFNIYLATLVATGITGPNNTNSIVGYILALCLFITGAFYIIFFLICKYRGDEEALKYMVPEEQAKQKDVLREEQLNV